MTYYLSKSIMKLNSKILELDNFPKYQSIDIDWLSLVALKREVDLKWTYKEKIKLEEYKLNRKKLLKYFSEHQNKSGFLLTLANYFYIIWNSLPHIKEFSTDEAQTYFANSISVFLYLLNTDESHLEKDLKQLENVIISSINSFGHEFLLLDMELSTIIQKIKFAINTKVRWLSWKIELRLWKDEFERMIFQGFLNLYNFKVRNETKFFFFDKILDDEKFANMIPSRLLAFTLYNSNKYNQLIKKFIDIEELERYKKKDDKRIAANKARYDDSNQSYNSFIFSYEVWYVFAMNTFANDLETSIQTFKDNLKNLTKLYHKHNQAEKINSIKSINYIKILIIYLSILWYKTDNISNIESLYYIIMDLYSEYKFDGLYLETLDDKSKRTRIYVELCHLFTRDSIKNEEFEWLDSINDFLLEHSHKNILGLYNLVLGKHRIKRARIWFDEKNLAVERELNRQFINFISNESETIVWKWEEEKETIQLLQNEESNVFELKAWFGIDLKKSYYTDSLKILWNQEFYWTYLEAIVSFLNTNWWTLVVWVRERKKYLELLNQININNAFDFRVDDEIPEIMIYWIWLDMKLKPSVKNFDDLMLEFDNALSKFIYPNPLVSKSKPTMKKKIILWKTIAVINVPKWDKNYFIVKEKETKDKFWKEKKEKLYYYYTRNNHWKQIVELNEILNS